MPPVIAILGTALSAIGGGSALAGAATAGSLAATGIGLGEKIAGGGSSGPSQSDQAQQELQQREAAQKQQQEQLQQAFKHFAPDAAEASSGFLTDQGEASLTSTLAGAPGGIGLALQTIFGNQNPVPQNQQQGDISTAQDSIYGATNSSGLAAG